MLCHLAKFGGPRYCISTDIMFLICHVIKQDHVIKGSCDDNDMSLSRKVTTQPSLVFIGTVVMEI